MNFTTIIMNTPKQRTQFILGLLKEDPLLSYNDCFTKHSQQFTKTRRTFTKDWNNAVEQSKTYQGKVIKAKESASIAIEVEAVKQGLKLKIDRVMFYQNQIALMEKQLRGETKFFFMIGYKMTSSHNEENEFVFPLEKQNEVRRQIRDYQIEISKMEGDYSPQAIDLTATIKPISFTVIKNTIQDDEE